MDHGQRIQTLSTLNKLAGILRSLNAELQSNEYIEKDAESNAVPTIDMSELERLVAYEG